MITSLPVNPGVKSLTFDIKILNQHITSITPNIKLEDTKIIPDFYKNRLVNHTQKLSDFEPNLFGIELLLLPKEEWPEHLRKVYFTEVPITAQKPSTPSAVSTSGSLLSTLASFIYSTPPVSPVLTGFTYDNRIMLSFKFLMKNIVLPSSGTSYNIQNEQKLFNQYIIYLISIFKSLESIDYTKINRDFVNTFWLNSNTIEVPLRSYTYIPGVTCSHTMKTGKNKGLYCNELLANKKCEH